MITEGIKLIWKLLKIIIKTRYADKDLCVVSSFSPIDTLDQKELSELLVVCESRSNWEAGPEEGDGFLGVDDHVVGVCLLDVANHGIHVAELRLDEHRRELTHVWQGTLHEDDVHNVVPNVPFFLNLEMKRN